MKGIMSYLGRLFIHLLFVGLVAVIVYQNSILIFDLPDLCDLTQEIVCGILGE